MNAVTNLTKGESAEERAARERFIRWLQEAEAAADGLTYRFLFMHPSGADLAYLASLIDASKLEVVIDRIFPFAEAKEAMAYPEAGRAKGKVVLAMR